MRITSLEALKRPESITDRHFIPDRPSQVERYQRTQQRLKERGVSLHELARKAIDEMLNQVEALEEKETSCAGLLKAR